MRKAFTLLEMLIAISLLSIIVIFLYNTYASLQKSNDFYGHELSSASHEQKLRKTIYLDLALSLPNSFQLTNRDKDSDVIILQSSHSVHRRIMPYIAYLLKDGKLLRVESSQKLSYPFTGNEEMLIDDLGEIGSFRIFQKEDAFLVHLEQDKKQMMLFRVNRLNDVVDF